MVRWCLGADAAAGLRVAWKEDLATSWGVVRRWARIWSRRCSGFVPADVLQQLEDPASWSWWRLRLFNASGLGALSAPWCGGVLAACFFDGGFIGRLVGAPFGRMKMNSKVFVVFSFSLEFLRVLVAQQRCVPVSSVLSYACICTCMLLSV